MQRKSCKRDYGSTAKLEELRHITCLRTSFKQSTNREQDLSRFLDLLHGRLWGRDRSG
jgi:hypothetical protein